MSANARALLPMIWLIASEDKDPTSGCVRGSYESVTFRLRGNLKDVKAGIQEIIKAGFATLGNQEKSQEKPQVTQNIQSGYETVTPETEKRQSRDREEAETEYGEKFFEQDWKSYPRKAGDKKKAKKEYLKTVFSPASRCDFLVKLKSYVESVNDPTYLKHGETFFRNWRDIEVPEPIAAKPKKKTTERHNLDLLKTIDLGGDNDNGRIQAGNGDDVRVRAIREAGTGNSNDLESVAN
jgi:hypothetical protein